MPLHGLLLVGYVGLVWCFWPQHWIARLLLAGFGVVNTAFLGLDGVVVGLSGARADEIWNSPLAIGLANLTGATWCAALLALAAARTRLSRMTSWLLLAVWVMFVLGAVVPYAALATGIALAGAAFRGYSVGAGMPFVLLLLAAILRQHVGLEAALGMLCLALAAALDEPALDAGSGQAGSL